MFTQMYHIIIIKAPDAVANELGAFTFFKMY